MRSRGPESLSSRMGACRKLWTRGWAIMRLRLATGQPQQIWGYFRVSHKSELTRHRRSATGTYVNDPVYFSTKLIYNVYHLQPRRERRFTSKQTGRTRGVPPHDPHSREN